MQSIDFQRNLLEIEVKIQENLPECEIWSDLGLTIEDYTRLGDLLRACIQQGEGYKRIRKLLERYPLCMLTHAVFHIVFDYSEEFWEPWAQTFGLSFSMQQQGETGQVFLETLRRHGFRTEYGEGYKYLTPIIAQAGVPNYCLDDLFELIDREGRQSFDPVEAVDELIHIRGYMVKRPLFRFLSAHRGRAASLLADIQDMMLSASVGEEEQPHGDRRIRERYQLWHEERASTSRQESRRRGVLSLPRLTFMDDGRGVCLVLPPFAPENEYADALIWRISQPDGATEVKSRLHRDADLCASREMTFPIRPFPGLSLSVRDDVCPERELASWKILGGDCSYLLFSMSGRRLPEESLPPEGCYLVLCSDAVEWSASDIACEPVSLSRMAGVRCFCLRGITRISELVIRDKSVHRLRVRSSLRILLSGGAFLFGEDHACWDGIRLYTTLPVVSVDSEGEGEILIQITHRQSGFKKTIVLSKGEAASLAPETYAPEKAFYGIYEIRGYESGHLKRSLSFGYTPAMSYNDFDLPAWPDPSGRWNGVHFCFTPPTDAGLSFDGVLSDHVSAGRNGFLRDVLIDTPLPYITGWLQVGGEYPFEVPFRQTIRAVQWNFWSEQDVGKLLTGVQVIDMEKIKSERWWLDLFLSNARNDYTNVEILGRRGGYSNSLIVTASPGGRWHVCLSDVAADIPHAALPVDVTLKTADRTVRLLTIHERVLLPGLRYFCGPETKDRPLIMWHDADGIAVDELSLMMANDPDLKMRLRMNEIRRSRKDQPYLLLPKPLERGRYVIEEKWSDDDGLFCDMPVFHPPTLLGENVFTVSPPTAEQTSALRAGAAELLEITLICPQNIGVLSETVQFMRRLTGVSARLSGEKEMKLLLTLAVHLYRVTGAASEENDLLAEFLFLIATKSLDDEARGNLTALMLSSRLTYEERSFCFKRLNLFLSLPRGVRLGSDALTLLGEFNAQAALLWRIRAGQPVTAAMLTAVVGLDALKTLVCFHPRPSCEELDWYGCLNRTLLGPCRCASISLPESIVGRSCDFQQMFNWEKGYGDIELLIERKPKGEMYFCGETYIDLMVRWHFEYQRRQDAAKKHRREECLRLARNLEASFLRLDPAIASLAQAYRCALASRKLDGGPFPIFYASALAALFSALYARGIIGEAEYMPARNLLIQAMYVIPDLVRRDVILAELYLLFTKGRESDVHGSHSNQANG